MRTFINKLRRLKGIPLKYWRIAPYLDIPGWLTPEQAYRISDLAADQSKKSRSPVFVEIGAWQGKSSFILGRSSSPTTTIYSIDVFNGEGDAFFEENYKRMMLSLGGDCSKHFCTICRSGG